MQSCLWAFSIWNKSVWNCEKLSEFILNTAHSLCAICEWTMRAGHRRKWTCISHVCSSHPLPWCPAIADWFELWSAGEVHLGQRSRGERDPLAGCGPSLEPHCWCTSAALGSCDGANTHYMVPRIGHLETHQHKELDTMSEGSWETCTSG